ncbi:MAG: SDR family oxidoreductase [Acidimicrobiales bacterium]|jgi:uncharacterized protein YbjT (DUF2867 family)|nr:SDR family oxidoreductase [Acidimicrobiales bacterium]
MASVLVTGATGYIGGRLVPLLLEQGHDVVVLARTPGKLDPSILPAVRVVEGDVGDETAVAEAARGVETAYYLVHSMSSEEGFVDQDRRLAAAFRSGCAAAGVGQIVYLGGLGRDDDPELSPHLTSRHEVGDVLRAGPVPVTELRAAIIIGSGSASFEMLRALVEVLPVMVVPKWVTRTRCQPVAVRDVLHHLAGVQGRPEAMGRVFEVGGPDVMTYREMMDQYAAAAGLARRLILPVPVLTPRLSALWIQFVTPLPIGLARALVDSLINDVVVEDRDIRATFPHDALGFRDAVTYAIARVQDLDIPTRWSGAGTGAGSASPLPTDPAWAGGTVLEDRREVLAAPGVSAADVFAVASGIGGDRGWFAGDWMWGVRGFLDKLVGGVGTRRGRRHPDQLRVGEALDFWRVEEIETDRLLRLRAEMRLPGYAWLEWTVEPEGDRVRLRQRARFVPQGLVGRAYWYAMVPFHAYLFPRLARAIVDRAAARSAAVTR